MDHMRDAHAETVEIYIHEVGKVVDKRWLLAQLDDSMTNHEMQRKMNGIFRLRRKAGYFGSIGRAGGDCSILCARAFLFR